jgi:hypothetical protein
MAQATPAAGVVGNARLTAVMGLVLTAMLAVEGATVFDVRGLITLHVFLGLMLIPPVLLKCASTMYRFGSYYGGRSPCVLRGAPHPVLRAFGPLIILSTLAVLGTGVWLIALGRDDDTVVTLHQASFIVWLVVTSVHFLGHLREALVDSWHELRSRGGEDPPRRRGWRLTAIMAALAVGVGVAAAFTPGSTTAFQHDRHLPYHHRFGAPATP